MNIKKLNQIRFFLYPIVWIYITVPIYARSFTTEIYPIATTEISTISTEYPLTRYERGLEDYDEEQSRLQSEGRGMQDEDMSSDKAIKNDPWQGYYDFLINEGSFKFWAVFQVFTAAVLIYSAFAAVYYAKYNFVQADYDYYDFLGGRSNSRSIRSTDNLWSGLSSENFLRILDAISSKKYS